MKLIRGIHNISQAPHKCVLTIGNFDGVHRGHQALLLELYKQGKKYKLPTVVIIFEPQPMEFFAGINAPARLMRLREKLCYLAKFKIDYLLCIYFNQHFALLTAENFISNLLIKHLGMKFLIVGEDFRFGANRYGDFLLLQNASQKYGFNISSTRTLYEGDIRISSTAIRKTLEKGDLQTAEKLLGHSFVISGRVAHGDKLGSMIGFPTANIPLHRHISPVKGIYAVKVTKISDRPIFGVANIGNRPTINGGCQQLEVHLFDTIVDLYNRHIDVILCKKIRDEKKFNSLDDLRTQILKDKLFARNFFLHNN